MKTYYSNDFTGHYPVGASIVIMADSEEQAREIFEDALENVGLKFDGSIEELIPYVPVILNDGDY